MKRFIVKAYYTQSLDVVASVPDHWEEEDVMQYFKDNGANGEFEEDPYCVDWFWDGADELSAGEYADRQIFKITDEEGES